LLMGFRGVMGGPRVLPALGYEPSSPL
jgi:hypothetical protein